MQEEKKVRVPWPGWEVVRWLGGGGFGRVYEIERDLYGEKERAAMKVIRIPQDRLELENAYSSGMTEEEVRGQYEYIGQRMLQEYQQMLEFKGHSNIVNCHDFFSEPNPYGVGCSIYIRMELLTPLEKALQTEPFSEKKIIQLGMDICRALELCGQKQIIHRDIKPGNIMVSEFGSFKLGDFGLARTMERTMSASAAGTDWYMAPEVAKKLKYGNSVDLYSLGLVLYWLLNQYRLPFLPIDGRITAKDMAAANRLRVHGEAVPMPAWGSPELKAVVLKALAYDSAQRYRSATEMLEALRAIGQPGAKNGVSAETAKSVHKEAANPVRKETEKPVRKEMAKKADVMNRASTILGICFEREEIHVRLFIEGASRPILTMPAVYVYNDLGEILTGTRASHYWKCHREKNLYSVLGMMRETALLETADRGDCQTEPWVEELCGLLMKELKRSLELASDESIRGIRECVVTTAATSMGIQRCVYKAMQEAGFRVLRQLHTASACALSEACDMPCLPSQEYRFAVQTSVKDEDWMVTAEYGDGVLEIMESRAGCAPPGLPQCRIVDRWTAREEERAGALALGRGLSEAAADGAAILGAKLCGCLNKDILLLDLFPWKVGLEVTDEAKRVCFPLTWLLPKPEIPPDRKKPCTYMPSRTRPVMIRLDSGLRGKRLRLYTADPDTAASARIIREWKLDSVCQEWGSAVTFFEVVLDLGKDASELQIELRPPDPGQKALYLEFRQYQTPKEYRVPLTKMYLPGEILQDVWQAAQKFRSDAARMDLDPAVCQGACMIAKQSTEALKRFRQQETGLRIDSFVEILLTIADNLEYGLKAVEKTDCKEEKQLLRRFYQTIGTSLRKLNLTPIEAEGRLFDPQFHYAMAIRQTDGVMEGVVIEEIQKGYLRGKELFRAAKVVVAE